MDFVGAEDSAAMVYSASILLFKHKVPVEVPSGTRVSIAAKHFRNIVMSCLSNLGKSHADIIYTKVCA